MGSRWKKSAAARALVEKYKRNIDFLDLIGSIIAILILGSMLWIFWKIFEFLLFQPVK
jgi:hypothetical protein